MELLAEVIQNPSITPENVEKARRTMRHLAAQSAAKVRSRAEREFLEKLFPGTFLSNPVVGTVESIDSISLEEIVSFHRNYFCPGNMIVTVVSALPLTKTAQIVSETLGSLPPGPEIERPPARYEPMAKGPIEVVVEGQRNYVIWGYPFPYDPRRESGLRVASDLFSSAITFQWREIEGGAYNMGASYSHYGDVGWFWTKIGTTRQPQDALEAVQRSFEEFKGRKVTENDVIRSVNALTGWRLMKLMTREGRAYRLAMRELAGDPIGDVGEAIDPPNRSEVKLPDPWL